MDWVAEIEQGVHEVEVVELLEDRGCGDRVAVAAMPLEESDPEGHLRQLVGIGIDLDAVELPGADRGKEGGLHSIGTREEDDLLFQILKALEGDVEEVARAAGGVEDMDAGETDEKGVLEDGGFAEGLAEGGAGQNLPRGAGLRILFPGLQEIGNRGAEGIPFPAEWGEQHRLNEIFNVAASGVFRAKGGAGGGIKSSLKECAEDRGIDRSPVEPGSLMNGGDLRALQLQHDGIGTRGRR